MTFTELFFEMIKILPLMMYSSTRDVLLNFRAGIYQDILKHQEITYLNETAPREGHSIIRKYLPFFFFSNVRKHCLLVRENNNHLRSYGKRKLGT